MSGAYIGEEVIAQATDLCVQAGVRTLATHLYGVDELEHARTLLEWMEPPEGARILDAGCGIGEVALNMTRIRPDLRITLLNLNAHQLDLCPEGFEKVLASFHETGLPAGSFDVVMFNTAICHADLLEALTESARLLRAGGQVFVSDVLRLEGDNTELEAALHVRAFTIEEWTQAAREAGLAIALTSPQGDCSRFRAMLGEPLYERLFGPLRQVIIILGKP